MSPIIKLFLLAAIPGLLFRYYYRNYLVSWRRLSDENTPVTKIDMYDGDEVVYVFSTKESKALTFKIWSGGESIWIRDMYIPPEYKNPYDYLISGELDEVLRIGLARVEVKQHKPNFVRCLQLEDNYKPQLEFNSHAFYTLNLF